MTKHIDTSKLGETGVNKVLSVTEFALQHKLTSDEQLRLIRLLGSFATRQELMMNARLNTKIR